MPNFYADNNRSIGHRSHLDRRYWISVDLDGDVPSGDVEALVTHSWDQVAATLTRKQRSALAEAAAQHVRVN